MGGADSEVSRQTTQIVFESAWFKPQSVRATSKRLGLRTEASYRFERGADHRLRLQRRWNGRWSCSKPSAPARGAAPSSTCIRDLPFAASWWSTRRHSALLGMDVPDDDDRAHSDEAWASGSALGGWQPRARRGVPMGSR